MSATDSTERGRAEPIDVEFEPADRPRKARSSSSDGIGFGTALILALFTAALGAAGGALAPRIPAIDAALDQVAPDRPAQQHAVADAASAGEYGALDQRVRSIESLIADPLAETASGGEANVSARVFAMQAGLRDVETRLQQIPSSQQIAALVAEVQRLQQELPAVAQQSRTAGEAARAAFAVAAAAEASRSSGPFEQSYQSLVALMPDDPNVRALAPLARTGAPTRIELRDSFTNLENDIIRAARQSQAGAGFWGRIQAALAQWVTVRREGEGDTPVGVVERASRRLAADDLAGAVQQLSRLSGAPARVAQPWLAQARRRLEIDTRLAAIRTELSRRG
ncbi:MAG: COG4223 family protein [Hyphomonadaceae bacterium]